MAWEMSFVCALLFGGFITNVQGEDDMYKSCCTQEVLACMNCFPLEPADVGLPPTNKTIEKDCPIQDKIKQCVEWDLIRCQIHTNYGQEYCMKRALKITLTADECLRDVTELCTEGSEVRERYLEHAECIREQKKRTDGDDKFVATCVPYPHPEPLGECDFMFKRRNCFCQEVKKFCAIQSLLLLRKWEIAFSKNWSVCLEREMKELGLTHPPSSTVATIEKSSDLAPHGEQMDQLSTPTEKEELN